jgi:hypothetical protein
MAKRLMRQLGCTGPRRYLRHTSSTSLKNSRGTQVQLQFIAEVSTLTLTILPHSRLGSLSLQRKN